MPLGARRCQRAFAAYDGSSSPSRGGLPPRRRMILSKALKSARAFRSVKKRAVWSAETFSATAVAMNWLMLVRSSRLNRSTASLSDRGYRNGYVLVSFIALILASASRGSMISTPNRPGTVPKSRRLKVTKASARPLTANVACSRWPARTVASRCPHRPECAWRHDHAGVYS